MWPSIVCRGCETNSAWYVGTDLNLTWDLDLDLSLTKRKGEDADIKKSIQCPDDESDVKLSNVEWSGVQYLWAVRSG